MSKVTYYNRNSYSFRKCYKVILNQFRFCALHLQPFHCQRRVNTWLQNQNSLVILRKPIFDSFLQTLGKTSKCVTIDFDFEKNMPETWPKVFSKWMLFFKICSFEGVPVTESEKKDQVFLLPHEVSVLSSHRN